MKMLKKTLTIALCLAFAMGFMMMSGLAVQKAYAGDYKYKIKVYSGKEGYFGDEDIPANHVRETEVSYGDEVKIDISDGIYVGGEKKEDLDLTQLDDATYYVRGVKETGHDSSEADYRSFTFPAEGDISFSVAYGMKGGMVKYVVNYVDEAGDELADPEDHYGMPGDKPVVSFKYIEGYTPQAYNLGKTLSENEAENVFTFTYVSGDNGAGDNGGGNQGGNQGANQGGGTDNGGAAGGDNGGADGGTGDNGDNGAGGDNGGDNAGAGEGTAEIGENETPQSGPADYEDLDDNETPAADAEDLDDAENGVNWAFIGGGAALVVAIAAAAVALARRRKEQE